MLEAKCSFCREEVPYLGHIVSRNGVSTDREKTMKVFIYLFIYLLRLYSTSAEGLYDTRSYSLLKMVS